MTPIYEDISNKSEDDRIAEIGNAVMSQRLKVGVFVDDEPGKVDRYIKKLGERFPGIQVVFRGPMPDVAGVILIKLAPPVV